MFNVLKWFDDFFTAAARAEEMEEQIKDLKISLEEARNQHVSCQAEMSAIIAKAETDMAALQITIDEITKSATEKEYMYKDLKLRYDDLKLRYDDKNSSLEKVLEELHNLLVIQEENIKEIDDLKHMLELPINPAEKARKWWKLSDSYLSPVRYAKNWDIEAVISLFDQSKHSRIRNLPIISTDSVMTAMAYTLREEGSVDKTRIMISAAWNTFYPPFRYNLLVHEFLHILEAEADIDINQFWADVQTWFKDSAYGEPTTDGNYIKYTLKFQLYEGTQSQYDNTLKGVEEFAYIGTFLAEDTKYKRQVSDVVRKYYAGILEGVLN